MNHGPHVVGVGGVVVRDGAVLLVRLTYSNFRGRYMLPGGVVEPRETFDQSLVREVLEETGTNASVEGLIAARCRIDLDSLNTYLVFLMHYVGGEPRADGRENDDVRFFTLAELEASDIVSGPVVPYARHVCIKALRGDVCLLGFDNYVPLQFPPGVLGWQGFM